MSKPLDTTLHSSYHLPVEISVKALLADASGRILLLQEPNGKYHFPGGVAQSNESLVEVLERELWEEARLRPADLTIGKVLEYSCHWPGRTGSITVGLFVACSVKEAPDVPLSEEHVSFVWADPHTACQQYHMVPFSDAIIASYLKAVNPEAVH